MPDVFFIDFVLSLKNAKGMIVFSTKEKEIKKKEEHGTNRYKEENMRGKEARKSICDGKGSK